MITMEDALLAHAELIEKHGGLNGIRDENLLEAALARPFGGFGDTEFYPSPSEKAAAILESIVKNHPFLDGNKRTGYTLMRIFLIRNNLDIRSTQDERYDFVIQVASGMLNFEQIVEWIAQRLVQR
ncbi:MAG: type II toxin-antitoxin system death-on-curing family toxin [Saprospiraceae bacterium]